MAFTLPNFRTLLTRVQTDLAGYSEGVVPRRSVEYFLARAQAGVARGLYSFIAYVLKQIWYDTSDETNFWHHFDAAGLTRKAAAAWQGTYEFTGTDTTLIPLGTEVQRPDGQVYETLADVTISSGTATADLLAQEASADSDCDDGQVLSLAVPVAGVDTDGEVQSTTTSGGDLESREDAQVRLALQLKQPPSGGGPGDYVRWALEVSGVTRAWEFANLAGPNTVSVAAVRDHDGTGSAILPDSGELAALLAHLEEEAPITVTVNVITLSAVALDVTLASLTPDNPTVRAAITESLTDLLEREAEPGGTLLLTHIEEAISSATGETDHVLTSPTADITYATNEMGVIGTLT